MDSCTSITDGTSARDSGVSGHQTESVEGEDKGQQHACRQKECGSLLPVLTHMFPDT